MPSLVTEKSGCAFSGHTIVAQRNMTSHFIASGLAAVGLAGDLIGAPAQTAPLRLDTLAEPAGTSTLGRIVKGEPLPTTSLQPVRTGR